VNNEAKPVIIGPFSDLHVLTANHDPHFQRFMDTFHPDWRQADPKIIRDFAKQWNFSRLYGSSPQARIDEIHALANIDHATTDRYHAGSDHVDLSADVPPPPADPPPPASKPADSPAKTDDVWPSIPFAMRRWDSDGLHTVMTEHGEMLTAVVPIEVMKLLARGYLHYLETFADGPVADDTLAETVAELSLVRPGAVPHTKAIAHHVLNAYLR
jgi:hypothetical protein